MRKIKFFNVVVFAIAVMAISAQVVLASPALVALEGNTPAVVSTGTETGTVSPDQSVPLVFGLRIRNQDQLERLITELSNPTSPLYHRWLTPRQFEAQFGPTQADVDTVTDYLRDHNIRVVSISPNRLLIQALATSNQISDVFKVQLRQFADGFSNTTDPTVPANIAKIVQSISGLNTRAVMRSHFRRKGKDLTGQQAVAYGPAGIATAYNFPNKNNKRLKPDASYSGEGVTLAIVSAYTYSSADLQGFYDKFEIKHTGRITNIPIGGTSTQLDDETTFDIEQATSQAPGADVLMYLAADNQFGTFDLAFNQVVCDNNADVISHSWGLSDVLVGWAQILTNHEIFMQAAAQGIVVFAASGDDGAYMQPGILAQPVYVADYPSSDPLVTAVGGTTLPGSGRSERAWTGSGGGVSAFWDRPAWQTGTGVPAYGWYAPANQKRNSPDVSLVADPETGYHILYKSKWDVYGGTSGAAPNWAALWVLAEEAAHGRIGGSNVTIYAIANSAQYGRVFSDILKGNNGAEVGPGYDAGTGWDFPTGWGTPNGVQLVKWLLDHQPAPRADDLGTLYH
jgi:kumamolisin